MFPDIEAVVQKDERFWVVEKAGAGELAARVDPRRVGLLGRGAGKQKSERAEYAEMQARPGS